MTSSEERKAKALEVISSIHREDASQYEICDIDRQNVLGVTQKELLKDDCLELMRNGIVAMFKDEEGRGPGVLREWFWLVGKSIFSREQGMFRSCPNSPNRYFPVAKMKDRETGELLDKDTVHELFKMFGRFLCLSFKNGVQLGVYLDRTLFVQLCGRNVSLEDIEETDPDTHASFQSILSAEPEDVANMHLFFDYEFDGGYGVKLAGELTQNGSNFAVDENNRSAYVEVYKEMKFGASMCTNIESIAKGFNDVAGADGKHKSFFNYLTMQDLDELTHGESDIDVEDWKAYTDYVGCRAMDNHIKWFWEVVTEMNLQQKQNLLLFWLAIKNVPIGGFGALDMSPYISRINHRGDGYLPTASTCDYELCLPSYTSREAMRANLLEIVSIDRWGFSFE